jgi:cell volume regulation protein A
VVIQGTTVPLVARRLRLLLPLKVKRRTHADIELSDSIKSESVEIRLSEDSHAVGREIVQLGFPNTALISIIKRNGKYITPSGSTVLNAGDILLVLSETKSALKKVYECLKMEPEFD